MVCYKRFHALLIAALLLTGCATARSPEPNQSIAPSMPSVTAMDEVQAPKTETTPDSEKKELVKKELVKEALTKSQLPAIVTEPEATDDQQIAVANKDLWQKIRDGYQLDHEIDKNRVRQEINWYKKHPEYIARVSARASKHLFYIVNELEARKMPLEIALLPVVESAFDPFAYSHGRASGLWQFIPSTARLYNLKIDWWYDGRRSIPDSTTAALDYLQALYQQMDNDWLVALAAYNSGQGNMRKAIRSNQRLGKPIDFWSLKVLRETRSYVPRLLAISEIIAHPETYGIELAPLTTDPYWTNVDIGSQLDLAKAAELADISSEELYSLNPGFNQWSTHPDGPYQLLLPVDKADQFKANLAKLPVEERLAWKRHTIKPGENLGSIAHRYHTTVSAIKAANNLHNNLIRAGRSLTIPMASHTSTYSMTADARLRNSQKNLEKKYGHEPLHYTVQSGDSFWDISRKYHVGMRELAKWNGMGTTQTLRPGMDLMIFRSPKLDLSSAPPPRTDIIRKVNYRVRQGESLSLIAAKFNLSVNKIKGWNRTLEQRKYIQPGDKITLYVDVTATH